MVKNNSHLQIIALWPHCKDYTKHVILPPQHRHLPSLYLTISTHLIILPVDEGQLEPVLCGVNSEESGLAIPVQAIDTAALHHGDVDRHV